MKTAYTRLFLRSDCPKCGKKQSKITTIPGKVKIISHCTDGCGYTIMSTVDQNKNLWTTDASLFLSLGLTETLVATLLNVQSVLFLSKNKAIPTAVAITNALLTIQEVQPLIDVVINGNQDLIDFYRDTAKPDQE